MSGSGKSIDTDSTATDRLSAAEGEGEPPPSRATADTADGSVADPARGEEASEREAQLLTRPTRRRWPLVLGAVLVTALVVLGLAYRWVQQQLDPPGVPGEEIAVVIPDGASKSQIADQLASEGVIANSMVFELYARYRGAGSWEAGQYTMRLHSSADDVLAILDGGGGEIPFDQVTVPEGLSVFAGAGEPAAGSLVEQVADIERFEVDDIMAVLSSGDLRSAYQPEGQDSLEGLLFPDTYRVEEDENVTALLTRMVERFDQVAGDLGYDDATSAISEATGGDIQISPYEAVIVASLIERETKIPEERAMVARVIYNRLAVGNPLGIDASTVYALGGRRPRTRADVNVDSPYNTRTNQGLPPTPIAVPGEAALRAALEPTPGEWFYYVLTDESGRHTFTVTAEEFERAAAECRAEGLC
jgi:UPF0755 protein